MFARSNKRRSASFPAPHSPDRRGSFRFWGSARRLRRSASTRTIARHCNTTDSSSSTEYTNETSSAVVPSESAGLWGSEDEWRWGLVFSEKGSLLSRIFRRSKRSQCQIHTFSAQFPPAEWFNSKAVHLHSVSTQTSTVDKVRTYLREELLSYLSSSFSSLICRNSAGSLSLQNILFTKASNQFLA